MVKGEPEERAQGALVSPRMNRSVFCVLVKHVPVCVCVCVKIGLAKQSF
jgi:hypothetical protein